MTWIRAHRLKLAASLSAGGAAGYVGWARFDYQIGGGAFIGGFGIAFGIAFLVAWFRTPEET